MRFWILLFLPLLFIPFILISELKAQTGEVPVDPKVLPNVVKIETFSELKKEPIYGTGFVVSREVQIKKGTIRVNFLVTNKHMVSDWSFTDGNIKKFNKYLNVHFYRSEFTPDHPTSVKKIDLCDKDGNVIQNKVFCNSNPLVDVAVVLFNTDLREASDLYVPSFDVSYLLSFNKITSYHFNIGSQVFVLGYPLGITSLRSNYPIAKFGYIASIPGNEFSINSPVSDRTGIPKKVNITGKLLIIDGLLVPGNSGGPVILPSVIKSRINPETNKWEYLTKPTENLVIGILSGNFGPLGLSLVY